MSEFSCMESPRPWQMVSTALRLVGSLNVNGYCTQEQVALGREMLELAERIRVHEGVGDRMKGEWRLIVQALSEFKDTFDWAEHQLDFERRHTV